MVLAANGAVTAVIYVYSADADADVDCSRHGLCGSGLTLDSASHSTLGLALFLLLALRTRSSYDKFWEGRKLWGLTVSLPRLLFRSVCVLAYLSLALPRLQTCIIHTMRCRSIVHETSPGRLPTSCPTPRMYTDVCLAWSLECVCARARRVGGKGKGGQTPEA